MKESNDTFGNRTGDLTGVSAVPQPTAPPAACPSWLGKGKGKATPLQAWTGPEGSRKLRLPDFKTVGT